MDMSARCYLITGASSGIGYAIAQSLANQGSRLVLIGRNSVKLEMLREELPNSRIETILCDLAHEESVAHAIEALKDKSVSFDGAVLCAGAHQVRPFVASKGEHFSEMYSSNVVTAVNGLRIFLKYYNKQGASVVMLSSAAAVKGGAGVSAYAAAKGALIALCKSLAVEFASKKIRVNVVLPGVVLTEMTKRFFSGLPSSQVDAIQKSHLLGVGGLEDIIQPINFLLTPGAQWITGSEWVIDGGLTCK